MEGIHIAEIRSKRNLTFAVAAAIAAILQTIGPIWYIQRFPQDWMRIYLYTITLLAFLAVAMGYVNRWQG
jgi:hypothetical protein